MTDFLVRLQSALAPAYTIERELIGAGMSRVFLATESALGRTVVVKVLPPDLAAGVNRDRFRREIQLAAQLQHPHIVPLLTAGEHGDLLYYTMPYVTGESVRARLEQHGPLPIRDVLRILTDIVDALAYAHAHGVVHRDIKPGNVLMQRSHALVTDFGVAKALSAALPTVGATTSGMAIGTPAYMAPEQLAADPAADHRVDIYAVGLLAYELLTGVAPFTGPSPAATMAAQLTRDPEPVAIRRPDVPPALAEVIGRCLSKEPDGRPASAEALLEALEQVPHEPFTPTRSTGARRAAAWPAGRTLAVIAVGVLAVLAILIARGGSTGRGTASVTVTADSAAARSGSEAAAADAPAPVPAAPALPGAARPAGDSARRPAGSGAAPARTLTRADSMAIAEAVRRELVQENARRTRSGIGFNADSLSKILQLRLMDSAFRFERFPIDPALAGRLGAQPRPGGRTSVGIVGGSPVDAVPALGPVERAIMDSLRTALRSIGRYQVRSYRNLPTDGEGDPGLLARSLGVDIVLTVTVVPAEADSVRAILVFDDPGAISMFARRAVTGPAVLPGSPFAGFDKVLSGTLSTLNLMARAPRRPPGELAD